MTTCDRCFDGRHIRCRGRNGCSCTYCFKKYNKNSVFLAPPPDAVDIDPATVVPPSNLCQPQRRWEGERDCNGRTVEQQAHYNELQKRRRQEKRGDPDWLLDKGLLVTKIQAVFARLEDAA